MGLRYTFKHFLTESRKDWAKIVSDFLDFVSIVFLVLCYIQKNVLLKIAIN